MFVVVESVFARPSNKHSVAVNAILSSKAIENLRTEQFVSDRPIEPLAPLAIKPPSVVAVFSNRRLLKYKFVAPVMTHIMLVLFALTIIFGCGLPLPVNVAVPVVGCEMSITDEIV